MLLGVLPNVPGFLANIGVSHSTGFIVDLYNYAWFIGLAISGLAYWLNRRVGESHSVACPSALIGASNFFELAVAAAISLFGFQSGAAVATVVGVLIEVPVMLLVVRMVNASKPWYERGAAVKARHQS